MKTARRGITNPFLISFWNSNRERKFYSSTFYLWIIGFAVIILVSCCCDSVQALALPAKGFRFRDQQLEAQDDNKFAADGAVHQEFPDPAIGDAGFFGDDAENVLFHNSFNDHAIRANDIMDPLQEVNNYEGDNGKAYIREPRAAAYIQRIDDDEKRRHYNKIPTSKTQLQNGSIRRDANPPQEEDDEDDFESLEANREAFLEILEDHAKHPHRRRSFKHHGKLQLKFDTETNRYSITEQQSDEW